MGTFLVWKKFPEAKSYLKDKVFTSRIQTLEVKYSAQTIMSNHKKELLMDKNHSYLEPDLKFHPYLLMDVKYNRSKDKTAEGVILWSLVDGEMVIDTKSWEKTHGFNDCIAYRADRDDFKIINTLASRGSADIEYLSKNLSVEMPVLSMWLEKCKAKNLIVQNGSHFRLHLQNPKILVSPETKLVQWLVSKSSKDTNRLSKRYRASQIENIAKAAFGTDFTIRKRQKFFYRSIASRYKIPMDRKQQPIGMRSMVKDLLKRII